jgi:4-hydroxybenzoate polyprenyltransferase
MNMLKQTVAFLLYSNVFMGIGAVCMVMLTQLFTGGSPAFNHHCWFVFFSTVFTYSFLKFRRNSNNSSFTTHQHWAQNNKQLFRHVLLISLIGSLALFFTLNSQTKLLVFVLAIVTAMYAYINIPFVNPVIQLRQIGLLKTAFVALVWSATTVMIPLMAIEASIADAAFLLLRRFLFVWALTIPFEIKDMQQDKEAGIRTLPMMLGIAGTKYFAQFVLLLLFLINMVQYFTYGFPGCYAAAFGTSLLVAASVIQRCNENSSPLWYYLGLDGMLPFQFLLVYFFCYLTA